MSLLTDVVGHYSFFPLKKGTCDSPATKKCRGLPFFITKHDAEWAQQNQ